MPVRARLETGFRPGGRGKTWEDWRQAESMVVRDPHDAARAAERIVVRVLADWGYPTEGDVEDRAAHLVADHPDVAERYRHGNAMLRANGDRSTENLRLAVLDFRAILDELVEGGVRTAA